MSFVRPADSDSVELVCKVCNATQIVKLPLHTRTIARRIRRFRDRHAQCETDAYQREQKSKAAADKLRAIIGVFGADR